MRKKIIFCMSCICENSGTAMSESEALIHKDNNPTHNVVDAEFDDQKEEIPHV